VGSYNDWKLSRSAQIRGPWRQAIQSIRINHQRRPALFDDGPHKVAGPFILRRKAGAYRYHVSSPG
jgi:hypothetical protein